MYNDIYVCWYIFIYKLVLIYKGVDTYLHTHTTHKQIKMYSKEMGITYFYKILNLASWKKGLPRAR